MITTQTETLQPKRCNKKTVTTDLCRKQIFVGVCVCVCVCVSVCVCVRLCCSEYASEMHVDHEHLVRKLDVVHWIVLAPNERGNKDLSRSITSADAFGSVESSEADGVSSEFEHSACVSEGKRRCNPVSEGVFSTSLADHKDLSQLYCFSDFIFRAHITRGLTPHMFILVKNVLQFCGCKITIFIAVENLCDFSGDLRRLLNHFRLLNFLSNQSGEQPKQITFRH